MKARTFDELLDAEYGVAGTPERERFDADSAAQQAQIAIDECFSAHNMGIADIEAWGKEHLRTPYILQPVKEPSLDEFYALIEQAQETAKKIGLTQKDIDREIKNMRAK